MAIPWHVCWNGTTISNSPTLVHNNCSINYSRRACGMAVLHYCEQSSFWLGSQCGSASCNVISMDWAAVSDTMGAAYCLLSWHSWPFITGNRQLIVLIVISAPCCSLGNSCWELLPAPLFRHDVACCHYYDAITAITTKPCCMVHCVHIVGD